MAASTPPILILAESEHSARLLVDNLNQRGYLVDWRRGELPSVGAMNRSHWAGIVVYDDPQGALFEAIERWRAASSSTPLIGLVQRGDVPTTVRAMQMGVGHVLEYEVFTPDALADEILDALHYELEAQDPEFICSPESPIRPLLELAPQLAHSDAPLLIMGEGGTGKGTLVHYIHRHGQRAEGPLITVSCRMLGESQVPNPWSDDGATPSLALLQAHQGTLWLQDVEALTLAQQTHLVELLRKPAHVTIERGSMITVELDVRVVVTSSSDLSTELARGRLSRDLYYQLNVLPVRLPPLRERLMDIAPLCTHFIAHHNAMEGAQIEDLSPEAYTQLKRYAWPGNVRELENVIHHLCVTKRLGVVEREDLPDPLREEQAGPRLGIDVPSEGIDMAATLEHLEKTLLMRALEKADGNKARAARLLGINRTTFVEKLKRKQIDVD